MARPTGQAVGGSFEQDVHILRELSEANPSLKTKEKWFEKVPDAENVKRWPGISVTNGRVTDLKVRVTSVPDCLGGLSALKRLDFSNCDLTALPQSLGDLTALTDLKLTSCARLQALPTTIRGLVNLATLNLGGCKDLAGLPDCIGELKALRRLDMWQCQRVSALPTSLGRLNLLSSLSVRYCKNLGRLPDELGQLRQLVGLDLYGCQSLVALPSGLGRLPELKNLDLRGCPGLAAGTSAELGALLRGLNASGCEVLGPTESPSPVTSPSKAQQGTSPLTQGASPLQGLSPGKSA